MAYSDAGLNPGAENAKGGPFMSVYHSADPAATVEGAGYFNSVAEVLANTVRAGMILVIDTNLVDIFLYGYTVTTADPPVVVLATATKVTLKT